MGAPDLSFSPPSIGRSFDRQPVPRVVDRVFEFSLLGMLAAGYFAVAGSGYLDWPISALALAALGFRALTCAGLIDFVIPNRFAAAFMVLAIGFFPFDAWLVSGSLFMASIHLVCFLAVLKVVTAKTSRDYAYLKMIAILELLAAAILSVSLGFFAFLALFLLFAIAAFASGEVRRSAETPCAVVRGGLRGFPRRLIALSVFLFGGILFMTVGLFFVLPRTAKAAIERFIPQRYHISGFSNGVTLGQIGQIKQSSRPVMHVKSYGGGGFLEVYWRGAALERFDGRRWDNPSGGTIVLPLEHGLLTVNQRHRALMRPGHEIAYTVRLSDLAPETLFIAGTPENIRIDAPNAHLMLTRGGSFNVLVPSGITDLSYAVNSFLEDEAAENRNMLEPLPRHERNELLQLPNIDARIPPLARQMSAGAESDADKAAAIENRLRHDYGYTLELLPAAVADPLANFLFDRKKGHCEYFASSMVVMLRTLGIPSRLVTGFQSGTYNPITQQQVVRASDAHSWVEAWIAGRGWTTYDPTPADPNGGGNGVTARLSMFFDAAEQFWRDWVVSYDLDRQIVLASRMDESTRGFRLGWFDDFRDRLKDAANAGARYAAWITGGAAAALLAALFGPMLVRWWRTRMRVRRLAQGLGQASDATVLYERMLKALARRGIHKPPWLTPLEFVRVLPVSEMSAAVDDLTGVYNELRFGGRADGAPRMMQLLDRLEKM
jgi:transglutaminase-like putative cysteine protease